MVSYADTAPVEVAEHLAPYVSAHSAVGADPASGDEPPEGWLELLGTAPDVSGQADIDDLAPAPDGFDDVAGLEPDAGLDFGTGAEPAPAIETGDGVEGTHEDGLVEILADPAGLDDSGDVTGWAPAEPADLTADLIAEESDGDETEPDDEPLG